MATPVGNAIPVPEDERIEVLVQGGQWQFSGERVLTYAFEVDDLPDGAVPWTAALRAEVEQALAAWSAVADISFERVDPVADIDQSNADLGIALAGNFLGQFLNATAIGFFPDPVAVDAILIEQFGPEAPANSPNAEGDIYLDNFQTPFFFQGTGGATREVILHEIGHALGLKHVEDEGANGRPIGVLDGSLSVMLQQPIAFPFSGGHAATPLLYDILAIQHIYGANTSTYGEDNSVHFLELDDAQRVAWDGGGENDVLDASHLPFGVTFSLEEGAVLQLSTLTQFAIAFNADIENAAGGAFADFITGNPEANRLDGREGNDSLKGGGGADVMIGGLGNDTYFLTHIGETVVEHAGEGTDTVEAEFELVLADQVENLRLADGVASGTGNSLGNVLTGNAGANTLDGADGADTLRGGAGDDTYFLDVGDVIVDASGTDHAFASASVTSVHTGVESIILLKRAGTASMAGAGANDHYTGNVAANALQGGAGNDTLEGSRGDDSIAGGAGNDSIDGGRGADTMDGGAGDDTYVVGAVRDQVIELAGGGTDLAKVEGPRYVLAANLENATVTRAAGAHVTGNALANSLDGGAGNDTLEGGGGADRFVFNEIGGIDRILDFEHGVDRLVFLGSVFTDAVSLLEYNDSTGALLYDGIQIAAFAHDAVVTPGDFQVI